MLIKTCLRKCAQTNNREAINSKNGDGVQMEINVQTRNWKAEVSFSLSPPSVSETAPRVRSMQRSRCCSENCIPWCLPVRLKWMCSPAGPMWSCFSSASWPRCACLFFTCCARVSVAVPVSMSEHVLSVCSSIHLYIDCSKLQGRPLQRLQCVYLFFFFFYFSLQDMAAALCTLNSSLYGILKAAKVMCLS